MVESLLKKEFQEKDVKRLRSLISGTCGESTQTMVGYEKKYEDHKEGDVWEEDGKVWKIEDGIKMSVSKLDKFRELARMPLVCPHCGKPMNSRLDKKMYPIHGMCFDCVTRFEDDLKRAGIYREYEKEMMSGNIKGFVQDFRSRIDAMQSDRNVTTVTDEGNVENWGRASSEMIETLNEWADIMAKQIEM